MKVLLRLLCVLPLSLPLWLPVIAPAQVIMSRRIYRQNGPSYQQIWNWNPASGALKPLTHSARGHLDPICSPDGKAIFFTSLERRMPGASLWSFNLRTGLERVISNKPVSQPAEDKNADANCPVSARAGDLLACAKGRDVVLLRNRNQVARARIGAEEVRIDGLFWSPSREWLLVATFGQNSNSSSPQSDYFAFDIVSRKVIPVGSGNSGMWVPGKSAILYTTPRVLAPLPNQSTHSVWVEHTMLFDPATKKTSAVTSGLTDDSSLSACPNGSQIHSSR